LTEEFPHKRFQEKRLFRRITVYGQLTMANPWRMSTQLTTLHRPPLKCMVTIRF